MKWQPSLGAVPIDDRRTRFTVWAPRAKKVAVRIYTQDERVIPLESAPDGYFSRIIDDCPHGSLYKYQLDGKNDFPDPASRLQPYGVHEASAVVEREFEWTDSTWRGIPLRDYVIYELHVGTFSPGHDFHSIHSRLDDLVDLGVTAIELLPVAAFPGKRNWGYDGVYLHAVQASYGGPSGLKALVDACHARGLAVVLDVVYNHFGPEGNYLGQFGHYFTDQYQTPWGPAVNFDDYASDEVRRFFTENALQWLHDYHIDALRLDAVHAIFDRSARPFLAELASTFHDHAESIGRHAYLIAETDAGDSRIVQPKCLGGHGLDAQWNDDFHHALHAALTGECEGYYVDFGDLSQLVKAYNHAYVYTGQKSAFRRRTHGTSTDGIPNSRFVVYGQNHDQTGNRMLGERFGTLLDFESQKLAAAAVILSPFIPLIFMGEEYGETAPFQYFIDHGDPALVEAVRQGRRSEFKSFAWRGVAPDPQAEETFQRSNLDWELRNHGKHAGLLGWYRELLRLRREHPAWASPGDRLFSAHFIAPRTIRLDSERTSLMVLLNFSPSDQKLEIAMEGIWQKLLDSAEEQWEGPGSRLDASLTGEVPLQLVARQYAVFAQTRENS